MTEGLRVAQLVHAPQPRGAELFARSLGAALARRGHEVRVISLYGRAPERSWTSEPGDLRLDGREDHPFERLPGWHPGLLRRLREDLKRWRPAIVQANGGATLKYAALASGAGTSWKLVYRNIGDPRAWLAHPVRRLVYSHLVGPRIDGIVAVAAGVIPALAKIYGPDVPLVHLPTAVDPAAAASARPAGEVRREAGAGPDDPVVLYVGSLSREKRVDRLLRAFAVAHRALPALRLWVVGDGPLRGELERLAAAAAPGAAVRFLGARPDPAAWISASDLVALTSDTEGLPAVLLEAGAAARPVVATRVGGVPECVEDGRTGLLVDPEDEAALAAALLDLARDPGRRHLLGKAARQRVLERFDLRHVAAGYEGFYRQVLSAAPGRGVGETEPAGEAP